MILLCLWLASFKVQEDVLRTILDKNNNNNGIISFLAKTATATTTTIKQQGTAEESQIVSVEPLLVENVSFILGNHMESIEHLDLQPWQKDTIQALQDQVGRQPQSDKLSTQDVCVPPASHISTSFCCGGNTKKLRTPDASKAHVNNPFACADKTVEDHERVRDIALRYMAPLPRISSTTLTPHNSNKKKNNTNNNRCDVCRIVQVLRDANLTMHFMGDSITHQMTYGWICELQNRNFKSQRRCTLTIRLVLTYTLHPRDGTARVMSSPLPSIML